MKDCLLPEVLEALSNRQYEGLEFFEILKHLEKCETCCLKIRPPTKEEILKRFEDDEPPPAGSDTSALLLKKSRLKNFIKSLFPGKSRNLSGRLKTINPGKINKK